MKHFKNMCSTAVIRKLSIRASHLLLLILLGMFSACLKENPSPAAGTPNDFIAIVDVRSIFKESDVVLSKDNMAGASKITGVVVSDLSAGNFPKGTIAIQQTSRTVTRGIEVNFGTVDLSFKPGDSLSIAVSGATIGRRNGVLQIRADLAAVDKISENILLTPTQVTLKELNDRFTNYESTLVKLAHVNAVAGPTTFAGDLTLKDISGESGILHTEAGASFASLSIPLNASYVGIARSISTGSDVAVKQVWPAGSAGIADQSGALYASFPEDFESPDNTLANAAGYSTKTGSFKTGSYTLTNVAIGKDANDNPVSGTIALRLNQNASTPSWTTMNYDLPNGASKVTIWAGSYGASADLGSTWRLEYSQNQGLTWSQVGDEILTISKVKQQFTFLMDLKGAVRFRVGKLGVGTSAVNNQNGRFSMDDLAIYENPGAGGPVSNPVPGYQTIMGWQLGTPARNGNEVSLTASNINVNLSGGVLSRGAGLIPVALARAFSSAAGGTVIPATKAQALSLDTYYQVSFTVKPGYKMSLSAIDNRIRRSAAGARYYRWYYSIDGVNFKETQGTGEVNYEGVDTEGQTMPPYYIYSTPELQNIPAGQTVTLRMYAWGFANVGSGNFSIGRTPTAASTNSISIGGRVEPG